MTTLLKVTDQTILYFGTFYNRKLVLPMQSILRERGDRAARRIFSKPPAACALPKHIYQGILCAVQSCCTAAVLTISVVDIFNVFAYVCNLKIRTIKLGYGTVCNQEEHWNELTCDMLISRSSASLCPHNTQCGAPREECLQYFVLGGIFIAGGNGEKYKDIWTKLQYWALRPGGPCTLAWVST